MLSVGLATRSVGELIITCSKIDVPAHCYNLKCTSGLELNIVQAAARHNPVLKPVAKRLKKRGKPHKLVTIAIARRLVTIANAIIKSGNPWRLQLRK